MGAPLVGVAPIFALSFAAFDFGKKLQISSPGQELNVFQLALAGGFSGIFTTSIMAPGERIKCILQVRIYY
jgi:solute carrier family 25 carnitine/acylcarnitine transporter 20/29